jgi:group I intron endonuclease
LNSGIYKILNTVNGNCYIGSATNLYKRFILHITLLRKNKHRNRHLQGAFNLYGESAFIHDIIEYCPKEKLIEREQFWIDSYRTHGEILYNIRIIAKSNLGLKHSEDTKKKIGNIHRGKYVSDETREKLACVHRGKHISAEHRQRIIDANTGKHYRLGMKASDETRKKLSIAHKNPSIETRAKLSAKLMGNTRTRGFKHSVETKRRMSESQKRRNEQRRIL